MIIYKTSLGKSAKILTIGSTLLFAFIIIGQYLIAEDWVNAIFLCTAIALALIYFITFGFRPLSYCLTNDELIIHRLFTDVKIHRNNIKNVELLNQDSIRGSIRTFGVGGLFGYYGKFFNSRLGGMTWYATRTDRMVMIDTIDGKKIIITPDDPDKFVTDWHKGSW